MIIHLKNGAPARSLFKPQLSVVRNTPDGVTVTVKDSALFSTWIGLKMTLDQFADEQHVVLDLAETFLVDHTTMSKLHELEREFIERKATLAIVGLEQHQPLSNHPEAGRKKERK